MSQLAVMYGMNWSWKDQDGQWHCGGPGCGNILKPKHIEHGLCKWCIDSGVTDVLEEPFT